MTVALALVCSDGIVMASDSMGSFGRAAAPATKLKMLTNLGCLWSGAGAHHTIHHVETRLAQFDAKVGADPDRVAQHQADPNVELDGAVEVVRTAMGEAYQSPIIKGVQNGPNGPVVSNHVAAQFLLAGWANGSPFGANVSALGTRESVTASGAAAIGSGQEYAIVAQGLMQHFLDSGALESYLGLRLAYRTIERVIAVSSQGIGPPVQLAVADPDGTRMITGDAHTAVKESVRSWLQIEADTLRELGQEATPTIQGEADLPTVEDE